MKNSLLSYLTVFTAIIIGIWFMKVLNIALPIDITTSNRASELSVVGEGKVEVIPDTAYVDVGVTTDNAATPDAAQNEINSKNNTIVEAMQKLGIQKENIKTTNYSLYPNYNYDNGRNTITGYSGSVTLTVKVSDVKKAAEVVQAATTAGANQVQGTRFVVDKPENYRETAREKAIANAKEQATKLAKSLGISLGKITNIVEVQGGGQVYPYMDKVAQSGGGGPAPDLQAGTQTINSVVTLYFEKK